MLHHALLVGAYNPQLHLLFLAEMLIGCVHANAGKARIDSDGGVQLLRQARVGEAVMAALHMKIIGVSASDTEASVASPNSGAAKWRIERTGWRTSMLLRRLRNVPDRASTAARVRTHAGMS